jgi:DNA-binding MarR family transcriptional regulator
MVPMTSADDSRTKLIEEVGSELGELRQAADRLDEAVAALYGLNRTDLRCLAILYKRGRMTAGELAEETGLTPGAITTVLDRMEKGGYANRVPDPADRRRVLIVSTVAAREVGARIYGEVEVASQRLLEPREEQEITAVRDYLRGAREVYEEQTGQVAAAMSGAAGTAAAVTADEGGPAESSAPVVPGGAARLEFSKGAARVVLRGEAGMTELYRGHFDGPAPDVLVNGNTMVVQQRRRFRPFDWRGQSSDITLNAGLPWVILFRGGMWQLDADLRGMQIQSVEIKGGASQVEIWLPLPRGIVPVRLSGGASRILVHRPAGAAMRAEVGGGASQLVFDDQRPGSIGGRAYFSSPGFNEAVDRYEVRFSGGASQITIDTL